MRRNSRCKLRLGKSMLMEERYMKDETGLPFHYGTSLRSIQLELS